MQERRTRVRSPEGRANCFQVEVRGDLLWFRLPFPVYTGPLLKAHADAILREQSDVDLALDVCMVLGAAIGLCWYDEATELETPRDRDVIAFGEQVVDELYESGWTLADVTEVGVLVLQRLTAEATLSSKEVEARMGFSRARRVSVN